MPLCKHVWVSAGKYAVCTTCGKKRGAHKLRHRFARANPPAWATVQGTSLEDKYGAGVPESSGQTGDSPL